MLPGMSAGEFVSRRLRLRYVRHGDPSLPLLVMLHGGAEHSRMWDPLAAAFAAEWSVVCPDLRGHGDSDWSSGAGYSTMECVYDLHRLLEHLGADRVSLIGHSFGGNVATRFAAIMPERVERLVVIEGLGLGKGVHPDLVLTGPPSVELRRWLLRQDSAPRRYASVEEAARRLIEVDPLMPTDIAAHAARHGLRELEDGGFAWKYDQAFRSRSREDLLPDELRQLWSAIRCPVLLVHGAESWASHPEEDGRTGYFADVRVASIAGAGHNAQHHRQEDVRAAIAAFLAGREMPERIA